MKKVLCIVLAALLAVVCLTPAFAAEEDRISYVLLGDSIAEGYGVMNSDEACYGRIVADTNGYEYHNFGYSATDSGELIERLQRWSEWSYYRSVFEEADLISLSIGANDYFDNDDVYRLAVGAFFGVNNRKLNAIADRYYENLCVIIDLLRAFNPDVTILLQKVYCVWYGAAAHIFRACASRVNAAVDRYAAAHPGAVVVCDISSAMNGHPENLADDCVHPNALGNIAIARVVLRQLYDLGLGTQTEPKVLAEGEDYNEFMYLFEDECTAKFITVLVKFLTGNLRNIRRG